jgi:hypothetical protein
MTWACFVEKTNVLFICKAKTNTFDRRHCGLARHFKTDPTENVALCFGYAKTPCLRAEGKLSSKQMNRPHETKK